MLTGSAFGADVAGPFEPDAPSGAGHLLLSTDVAAMDDPAAYAERVEAIVDATQSAETAPWADRILIPGELEDRNLAANAVTGITLTATTWTSLVTLGAETQVDLPPTEELAA